ncbi:hypothetical protein NKJ52_03115 [Mesorhizobium australicum]|uniref:hypothetical protein n=1 Tax=Mesorhizobium australicum TaxID=536018 RepID=UPI003335EBAB
MIIVETYLTMLDESLLDGTPETARNSFDLRADRANLTLQTGPCGWSASFFG